MGGVGGDRFFCGFFRDGDRLWFGDREGYRSVGCGDSGFGGDKGGVFGEYWLEFRGGWGGFGCGGGGGSGGFGGGVLGVIME